MGQPKKNIQRADCTTAVTLSSATWSNLTGCYFTCLKSARYTVHYEGTVNTAANTNDPFVRAAVDGNNIGSGLAIYTTSGGSSLVPFSITRQGVYIKKGQVVSGQAMRASTGSPTVYNSSGNYQTFIEIREE